MIILNAIFRYTMILGSLVLSSHCFSQLNEYSFSQIDELLQNEPKNTVVFLHTDWCSYCNIMEKGVFKNTEIIELLNSKYYYVSLNGESKEDIKFAGNIFKFRPNGYKTGTHELATALGTIDNKLSYPTIVILNDKYEIIFQYGGLLDKEALKKIL